MTAPGPEVSGSRTPAQAPNRAKAPKPAGPTHGRLSEAVPRRAPISRDTMITPAISRGLSAVPNVSIAVRTNPPGAPSMNRSPTAGTSSGMFSDSPATTSVVASASAAASAPPTAARRRTSGCSLTGDPTDHSTSPTPAKFLNLEDLRLSYRRYSSTLDERDRSG